MGGEGRENDETNGGSREDSGKGRWRSGGREEEWMEERGNVKRQQGE